jgi:hypothetical protein
MARRVAAEASEEDIEAVRQGETSIRAAYNKVAGKEKEPSVKTNNFESDGGGDGDGGRKPLEKLVKEKVRIQKAIETLATKLDDVERRIKEYESGE